MSPRSSKANVDFVFVAPEKKRPWAAFSEVATKAQFTVDRLDPEMIYARMVDDTGELPPVDTRILRCSDALQLIRYNAADMAIVGRDTLNEFNEAERKAGRAPSARIVEPIPVSECKLKFLVPGNDPTNTPEELARLDNKRIATSFPLVVEQWLSGKGIKGMEIIEVDGKVESWVRDGIAGAACDLVEKGETAKRYGLRQTDMVVFDSSSLIVRTDRHRGAANEAVMERFSGRLYAAARALKSPSA